MLGRAGVGAAGRWGGSVAEHGPRELVGERVPALDPLVLVLQAIKPVLQALALGIDAQNHAACRGEPRGSQDTVTSDSQGLSGASTPWHPSQTLCSTARLSSLPTCSEGGPWSDCHTLGAPTPPVRAQGSCSSFTQDQSSTCGAAQGLVLVPGQLHCTATKPTPNVGPRGLRVQPEGLTIITFYPCSTRLLCDSARPLALSGPLSLSHGVRLDHVYGPNFPHRPGRQDCGLIQGPCPLLNPGWACC